MKSSCRQTDPHCLPGKEGPAVKRAFGPEIKARAAEPGDLSVTPGIHTVEEEDHLLKLVL